MSQGFLSRYHDPCVSSISHPQVRRCRSLGGSGQQRDVGRLWPPDRFPERSPVDQRLPGILALSGSAAGPGCLARSPQVTDISASHCGKNFAGGRNPTARPGSAELMVESTCVSSAVGAPKWVAAHLCARTNWLARSTGRHRRFPCRSVGTGVGRPAENMCQHRLRLDIRGSYKREGSALVQRRYLRESRSSAAFTRHT